MQTRSSDAITGPQTRSQTRAAEAVSSGAKTRSQTRALSTKPSVGRKILSEGKKAFNSIKKYAKKSRKAGKTANGRSSKAASVSENIVKAAAESMDQDERNSANIDKLVSEGVNSVEEQEVAALLSQVDDDTIVHLNDGNLSESSPVPSTEGEATLNKRKRADDDEDDSEKPGKIPKLDDGTRVSNEASGSGSTSTSSNLKRKRSDDDLSDAPSAKTIRGDDGSSIVSSSLFVGSGLRSASTAMPSVVSAPAPTSAPVQNVAPIPAAPIAVIPPAPVPTIAASLQLHQHQSRPGSCCYASSRPPQAVAPAIAPVSALVLSVLPMPAPTPVAPVPQPAPHPNALGRTRHFRIPVKDVYTDQDFDIRQWEY
ncbi:hypothetical protein CPB85DRAFT_1560136 [Mucidula mucida]|nr:hypothetical protein CPB85DRAFT_1560136 [Mucidula mucida]